MRIILTQLSGRPEFAADCERSLRSMLELIRRAHESGELWDDIVVQDIVLTLQAGNGIRGRSAASHVTGAQAGRCGHPVLPRQPGRGTAAACRRDGKSFGVTPDHGGCIDDQ
ncbi:hypothetical protein [Streptomyces parvulus]|uniref:hypothetical protein n=1 Tax=Streptomyces parvulus TaxID=146923 RepID=UPI0033E817FC